MSVRDPLGHSMDVVRWMAEQAGQVGVREAAAALGMSPSTVSRRLAKLCDEGIVLRNPQTGGYSLGLELIRLGYVASRQLDVRSVARPYLVQVANFCNETVTLGLYDSGRKQLLRIDQIPTSHPLNYVIRLDEWTDIFDGASGVAVLAFLPPDQQEYHFQKAEALSGEGSEWRQRKNLEPELAQIRKRGYACTHGRRLEGAVGIGAPIFGIDGVPVGDVIVSVPEVRWHQYDEHALARVVMDAARGVSTATAGRQPTSAGSSPLVATDHTRVSPTPKVVRR